MRFQAKRSCQTQVSLHFSHIIHLSVFWKKIRRFVINCHVFGCNDPHSFMYETSFGVSYFWVGCRIWQHLLKASGLFLHQPPLEAAPAWTNWSIFPGSGLERVEVNGAEKTIFCTWVDETALPLHQGVIYLTPWQTVGVSLLAYGAAEVTDGTWHKWHRFSKISTPIVRESVFSLH